MKNVAAITLVFALFLVGAPKLWQTAFEAGALPVSAPTYNFPATFRLLHTETGAVSELTAVDYLVGCLYAEISPDYELEALKAQAVAAHTYALRLIRNHELYPSTKPEGADLTDAPADSQAYFTEEQARDYYGSDYDKYYANIRTAAEYGAKRMILHEGKPIYAVYTAATSGMTNTADSLWNKSLPYLRSVGSAFDEGFPNFEATKEISVEQMRAALLNYDRGINMPVDYYLWFSQQKKNAAGYTESIQAGDTVLSGGDLWRIFELRSADFDVAFDGTAFVFVTRGLGHGAGLSQYGANVLANRGKTAEDILGYYYSGVEIANG
ncbi:MAG: SpoIID/LytB domain-containing protein [Oscillospiraceae bacterium]|jgi:stage II sporulation protein D|nr:SpoIID/LytB domain-containing protein [Oscillospiraceae bacterium]